MPKKIISIFLTFLFSLIFAFNTNASDCKRAESLIDEGNEIVSQKPSQAEKLYREAVILCPESANAQYNLGISLYALGSEKGAIEAFKSALKLDPNHEEAREALSFTEKRLQKPKCF